ncbi:MAG: glycosyltransferase family 4 protein [Candidatus Omnitrophota bacterium]
MVHKKNILELIAMPRVSPGLSGGDRVIIQLGKAFALDEDKKVTICILRDDQTLESKLKKEADKLNLPNIFIEMKSKFDLSAIFKLRKILKNLNIEILHTHGYKADLIGFFAGLFLEIKLLSTVHGWIGDTFLVKIYDFMDKVVLRGFDNIVVVCEKFKLDLIKFGINKNKIKIIHNGIDLNEIIKKRPDRETKNFLRIAEDKKVITVIGRLSLEKGHKYFLAAAKKLVWENQDLVFLIVGDGPLESELKRMARIYNIEDKVIFAGFRDDVADIISISDVIVLPSLSEGFPLVILEAMSMAKPVVATDVGDVKFLVKDTETGVCVKPAQTNQIQAAINKILTNPNLAQEMANQGKKLVNREYKIENMIEKYKEIYE